jgi:hypothetical protein
MRADIEVYNDVEAELTGLLAGMKRQWVADQL